MLLFERWCHQWVKERADVFQQFAKFCFVGVSNLILDGVVYWGLTRIFAWHYLWAKTFSFLVAVTWSFIINYRWTFKSQGAMSAQSSRYAKFFLVSAFCLFLSLSFFYLAVEGLGIYDLVAMILIALLTAVVGFTLNKSWTFSSTR